MSQNRGGQCLYIDVVKPSLLCSRTLQSTPESGACAGYAGAKRKTGGKMKELIKELENKQ
jgi:hypothetical protein